MNRFAELKTLVLSLEDEFQKFYEKDNKAAGTRVRKGMQTLKKIAQEIRANVSASKASMDHSNDADGK
ncbi:histone H1 [Cardinium endosymbiont of Philonthus spinipes]|uniref:histone H1 n=1 Tax=Cardinium endosymbiont of Philonthus spinipes TaxID=3077941 RepID=UPI00313E911D